MFVDQVGDRTLAKYRISAYQKSEKKKLVGEQSYFVQARTYRQGDKKVNAGQVKTKIAGEPSYEVSATHLAYYETIKLSTTIKPSTFSKATGKKILSKKVRWYSSNLQIAIVNKNGLVKAKAKKGKCYVYTRAHNGKRSNKIAIHVKNYAKPPKDSLVLGEALDNQDVYGFALSLFYEYYETTTDIAEYFYINRPKGDEIFQCEMIDGEIIMSPENYVSGEMKQKIYNFVKDFSYDVRIYVASGSIRFQELSGAGEFRRAGMNVVFRYNKNIILHLPYTQKYELAENWIYGYFEAI